MKIQPYIAKLNSSKQFRDFMSENSKAYLVAGFFILDFETGQNIHQVDYYIPNQKKVAAFNLDTNDVDVRIMDMITDKTPEKLEIKTKIDLDALKGIIEDEMKNRSITEEIRKIIAILQTIDGDKIWNVNCILSGMEILRAHIEDDSKTVLKMERASVLDYMKKIPGMRQQLPAKKPTKQDIEEQITQLDKVKETLEKEKEKISKSKDKNKGSASSKVKPAKSLE